VFRSVARSASWRGVSRCSRPLQHTSRAGLAETTTVLITSTGSTPLLRVRQVNIQCVMRYLSVCQSSRSVAQFRIHTASLSLPSDAYALPCFYTGLMPLAAGLSTRRHNFDPRIVYVRIAVDETTVTAFSPSTSVFPRQRHSTNARYSSSSITDDM
jgi:hypothetical protein